MCHLYAFGLPGRTRCINDISKMSRMNCCGRERGSSLSHSRPFIADGLSGARRGSSPIHRGSVGHLDSRPVRIQAEGGNRCPGHTFTQMCLRQYDAYPGVFKNHCQASLWIVGVKRYVDSTGLEHSQQSNHYLQRAFHTDANHPLIFNSQSMLKVAGKLIGASIQLLICQHLILKNYRNRLRSGGGLPFKKLMKVALCWILLGGCVPGT